MSDFLRPPELSVDSYVEVVGDLQVASGATFSPDLRFRYHLWRRWFFGEGKSITFLMCNPSTADAFIVDPTVRKCLYFAKRDGYVAAGVVNLFALRSTSPKGLRCDDPIGPANDAFLRAIRGTVCLAWGGVGAKVGGHKVRPWSVIELLRGIDGLELMCLGRNGDGTPKHPCYLTNRTELEPWEPD